MGCGVCEVVCPSNAIKITMSQDGFLRPSINISDCINCNQCDSVCPISVHDANPTLEAYSYKSNSAQTLKKSASGGFGYDFSSTLIGEFPVCSVEYDKQKSMPVHKVATSLSDLDKRRNSIYLQSYTVPGFKEIIELKRGVVFGSPCQISALNNLLIKKKLRENYILVDFFCHGIPSYNVWKKYMETSCVFAQSPDVIFRSKKYGWGSFTIQCSVDEQEFYFDKANDDIFFRVFLENMALNESCYTCPYHGNSSSADIRIGDFWGEKYKDDSEGITGILVFTETGKEAINKIIDKGNLQKECDSDVLSGQINKDLPIPSCRAKLLCALQTKKTLKRINRGILFRYKLIRKINRMIGRRYV